MVASRFRPGIRRALVTCVISHGIAIPVGRVINDMLGKPTRCEYKQKSKESLTNTTICNEFVPTSKSKFIIRGHFFLKVHYFLMQNWMIENREKLVGINLKKYKQAAVCECP